MDKIDNHIKDLDKYVRDMDHSIELMIYDPVARSIIYNRPRILDPIINIFLSGHEQVSARVVGHLRNYFRKQRS